MSQDQAKLDTEQTIRTQSGVSLPAVVENSSLVKVQPNMIEKTSDALKEAQRIARLRAVCRHLRATNRCPGECVLSRSRQERLLREMENLEVS
jgi:hypothetical protein